MDWRLWSSSNRGLYHPWCWREDPIPRSWVTPRRELRWVPAAHLSQRGSPWKLGVRTKPTSGLPYFTLCWFMPSTSTISILMGPNISDCKTSWHFSHIFWHSIERDSPVLRSPSSVPFAGCLWLSQRLRRWTILEGRCLSHTSISRAKGRLSYSCIMVICYGAVDGEKASRIANTDSEQSALHCEARWPSNCIESLSLRRCSSRCLRCCMWQVHNFRGLRRWQRMCSRS